MSCRCSRCCKPSLLEELCPCHVWERDFSRASNADCRCMSFNNKPRCKCCCNKNKKVKARFGLAWVLETPFCSCREPCGWQVEFTDTPSKIEQRCKEMIDWVNAPPLPKDEQESSDEECDCDKSHKEKLTKQGCLKTNSCRCNMQCNCCNYYPPCSRQNTRRNRNCSRASSHHNIRFCGCPSSTDTNNMGNYCCCPNTEQHNHCCINQDDVPVKESCQCTETNNADIRSENDVEVEPKKSPTPSEAEKPTQESEKPPETSVLPPPTLSYHKGRRAKR